MTSEQSKPNNPRRRGTRGGGGGRGSAAPKRNGGGRGGGGSGVRSNGDDVDDANVDGTKPNRRNVSTRSNNGNRPPGRGAKRNGAPGRGGRGNTNQETDRGSGGRPRSNSAAGRGTNNSNSRNPNRGRRNNQSNNNDNERASNSNDRRNQREKSGRRGNNNNSSRRPGTSNANKADEQENSVDNRSKRTTNNNNNNNNNNTKSNNKSRTKKTQYSPHAPLSTCLHRYTTADPTILRGKLRVMPSKNGTSFVTCDRGSLVRDVVIQDERDRNRALDGDFVFVELYPLGEDGDEEGGKEGEKKFGGKERTMADFMTGLDLKDDSQVDGREETKSSQVKAEEGGDECIAVQYEEEEYLIDEEYKAGGKADNNDSNSENFCEEEEEVEMWHDDDVQMSLWEPVVNLPRKSKKSLASNQGNGPSTGGQRNGKVIFIIPPKFTAGQQPSELNPEDEGKQSKRQQQVPKRTIVGTLTRLPGQGDKDGRYLLVPNNKSLPRFMCPLGTKMENDNSSPDDTDAAAASTKTLYRAEYSYGSWHATNKWPPCTNVSRLCGTCNVHDETKALLVENGVDHGDFSPAVLRDVEQSVKSGRFFDKGDDMGWKPTEEMCRGRRDYRDHRVFTIDPTTAKDLDDALHITPLPDGRVEIGVHIADVSHFIQPNTAVDEEALKRATTVYLVNGIVPMLPKPLCEIACSLNENVERLAFSCVWKMNMDGTLSKKGGGKGKPKKDDIWYGRTVIKSCARLDYATAQNIIDEKVANGEKKVDEKYWPKSRQPTGGHTIAQVAADVRLMHKVAMARRKLRFENGALALNGVKLAFRLDEDGETPQMCAPYPIRDSNRLIEEFMLLANYLVAQRLITHAHGRALLRNHAPPIEQGMQQVVDVSRESFNFDIDTTNSNTLQESLSRLSRECNDELVVQCVTESLMTPMRPAEYMAAGELDEVDWQHFALNIPYYTHFTSPIRRYPDVIVHRLLQATLDEGVDDFPLKQKEIHTAAGHCNDMRMSAKKAQERSDRVFLSLFLKENPISSTLGVCLGVGEKTFTVFVPSLGMSTRVFLQEHEDDFNINAFEDLCGKRKIIIQPKTNVVPGMDAAADHESNNPEWKLDIKVFTKLEVACTCKMQPPIDVRVKVVGPWTE